LISYQKWEKNRRREHVVCREREGGQGGGGEIENENVKREREIRRSVFQI
jgi:hypothetical protein